MVKDGKERPSDSNASGEITLGGGECVSGRGGLEEEQGEEDKDFGEDTGRVALGVHAERVKGGEEDEEGRESVPQGERKVNKEFVKEALGGMLLLGDVVDVGDGGAYEEGKDECDDVVAMRPDVDVDGVEEEKEGEAPVDAVDDDLLAALEELVDDGSEEQEVDDRPDAEGPAGWGQVGLLTGAVDVMGTSNGVDVASGEEDVNEDVDDLEKDTFSPV